MSFPTDLESIQRRIEMINPERYASSRNFQDGAVTYLSPYISRGVISTKQVVDHLFSLDLPFYKIEKLVQELAWRDYWQQVWIAKGDEINEDLKRPQENVTHHRLPSAVLHGQTGIQAVDDAIHEFYETGYIHNHMRMYIASIACNVGQAHWKTPAQWMYAHLLDGDWASNTLSWQWVAGSNAGKKYYANQENINKYFSSSQRNSYLDRSYESLVTMGVPMELQETSDFQLETPLPASKAPVLIQDQDILIYNYYNIDPQWHKEEQANRILLLEPSFFKEYPVSEKCINFVLNLSEEIHGIQVFVGEFDELKQLATNQALIFKEHPTSRHYIGKEEPRDWICSVEGYFKSFFAFWKKCKKEIELK